MDSLYFYLSMDCGECDETIYYGPCLSTLTHEVEEIGVIPFDIAAQTTFNCRCGATYLTGDFEAIHEDEL